MVRNLCGSWFVRRAHQLTGSRDGKGSGFYHSFRGGPSVEGLPASRVKAEVLLDAPSALSRSRPPHIGTQPQQTAEKPNP
jgi:hypothetical protein